jgi:large subunit ribosomal protein L4
MAALFQKIGVAKPLVVTDVQNEVVEKSTRNIPGTTVLHVDGLNVYDIVNHPALVLTREAVLRAEEALA